MFTHIHANFMSLLCHANLCTVVSFTDPRKCIINPMEHSDTYDFFRYSLEDKNIFVIFKSAPERMTGSKVFAHANDLSQARKGDLDHVVGPSYKGYETPMVWVMILYIYVLYSPDWHYRSTMPTFLFLYGTIFAVLHSQFRFVVGFQLHYMFLAVLCLPRMYKHYIMYTTDPPVRKLVHRYILFLILGAICWLVDRNLCNRYLNYG